MMDIKRILMVVIGIITTSFFYFPLTFAAFPVTNTKNLMAALGGIVAIIEFSRKRQVILDNNLITIGVMASLVSMAGLFSVSYNETPDYTYALYIRPFFIWLLSAYFVVFIIKKIHGAIGAELLCNYLIVTCVFQCVSVLVIDSYPSFKNWVDNTFIGLSDVGERDRLYGIGAWLDVGASRFASILIMIGYILTLEKITKNTKLMYMYILSFMFILIVGSMVGRTTNIGGGIALLYLLWKNRNTIFSFKNIKVFAIFVFVVVFIISVAVYYYNNNFVFKENVRFAFEGFFNWWEKGEWTTTSTERWKTMIVWPDNMKTWLIGDGYFSGPSVSDPYYVGPFNYGFYKGTDIGYLRFIYYFGLIGLILFMLYFCKVAAVCASRFSQYRILFLLLLLFNFAFWCKVSTDIFLVFALFLCISKEENDEYEKSVQRIQ